MRNIRSALPLGVEDGARGAGFDLKSYTLAMAGAGGSYMCHINIFWLDMQFIAMAGVPVRGEAVDQLALSSHFTDKDGCLFPAMVEVGVQDKSFNPLNHKGALQRISPPEEVFAFVLRMAQDLDGEGDGNRALAKSYRRACLDVP